jgi:hypothetical protein
LHSGGVFGRNDAGEILGGCGRQIVRCPAGRRAIAAQSHLKGWRWIVDARKSNGCRYIVESAEVLSAFLELEATLLLTGRFYWGLFRRRNLCKFSWTNLRVFGKNALSSNRTGPDVLLPGASGLVQGLQCETIIAGEEKKYTPMNPATPVRTKIVLLRNSITRSPLLRDLFLVAPALTFFALSPTARGQLPSPKPDGGYPNGNTAEGDGALFSVTTGANDTAVGFEALFSNTTGRGNTATGYTALFSNIGGAQNTATGVGALYNNKSSSNTADGFNALYSNTSGNSNMANGYQALYSNTTGSFNTASGGTALFSNTTAGYNTATGYAALYRNTSGLYNMANGYQALYSNTTGNTNTASGYQALYSNTTSGNTATGYQALLSNTTGGGNTANGFQALSSNTIGGNNIANGFQALFNNTTGSNNTADGLNALYSNTTGTSNIALGVSAGANLTTGSNNIDIFDGGVADEANTIRIGQVGTQNATFIAGISGATVAAGVGVVVDANGNLGTITSSERFKDEIQPMDKASETILALNPVAFRYKHELDPNGIPQFGLVAEQVEKVDPDLVVRDDKGQVYAVRYEAVNAMLLNEFLKEHRTVQELNSTVAKQEAIITQQQKRMEAVIARLEKQESQIEKASASSR